MEQDNIYFASKDPKETAGILLDKSTSFYNVLQNNEYLNKLERMWAMYHGADLDRTNMTTGHRITFGGEQGEIVNLKINHFRNLAQHIFNMITSNRPTMEARAVNTDYKSLAQTQLANGILDYYMRDKRLEDYLKKAVEMAIVMGSGFIKMDWNASGGDVYDADPETGQIISEGDVEFSNLSPFDVVFDGTKDSYNNDWILTRSSKNKYDLIAKYPEYEDKIKGIPSKNELNKLKMNFFSNDKTDDVFIYEFYHKRTDSMPNGRYMLFLSEEIVLIDLPMPYRVIPIFRVTAGEIIGTPYGYTPMFDIYPIQEASDALYSTVFTNQNAFGVQNVFIKTGSNLSTYNLDGALNVLEGDEAPVPLNLTQTPAEVFKFLDMLVQAGETISGVNSVARGNPQASLESGNALALVQSMALQFISGLQGNYVRLIEDVGTSLIQILKDFANTPKVIAIVGKNNRPLLKEFTGDSISAINRVIVDVGNPLSRTTAGRVQMADQLLQMKLLKNANQYFQVITTGRLDTAYEGEINELLLVKSENEQMLDGVQVQAVMLDAHAMHIQEHKTVLSDPDLRRDPQLVQNVLGHIQTHIDMLRNGDPDLLQLLGQQPLNPNPQAGAPELPPGPQNPSGAPGEGAPIDGVMEPTGQPAANAQGDQQINNPNLPGGSQNLPSLPKVPAEALANPGLQEQSMGNVR
jgi:hypothetical protein